MQERSLHDKYNARLTNSNLSVRSPRAVAGMGNRGLIFSRRGGKIFLGERRLAFLYRGFAVFGLFIPYNPQQKRRCAGRLSPSFFEPCASCNSPARFFRHDARRIDAEPRLDLLFALGFGHLGAARAPQPDSNSLNTVPSSVRRPPGVRIATIAAKRNGESGDCSQ